MMFGKTLPEYLRFQKTVLIILAVVGLGRLAASLAGVPDATVKWLAMNAVIWAGAIYYGIAAHRRGFGTYKHLLPLVLIQAVLFQAIAVLGILLAIAGFRNIFAAPEYSFQAQSQWIHLFAHLTIGILAPTLILWAVASLAMLITKKVAPVPAVAPTVA
jgi:hypothetical protein